MKCMVIAVLAVVAAVQAKPYSVRGNARLGADGLGGGINGGVGLGGIGSGTGGGVGLGGIGSGIGASVGLEGGLGGAGLGGVGLSTGAGIGGGYRAGAGSGHASYAGGSKAFDNNGYASGALEAGHNKAHQDNDFSLEVRQHQSSGHDIGGVSQVGSQGHRTSGYGTSAAGTQSYGKRYSRSLFSELA